MSAPTPKSLPSKLPEGYRYIKVPVTDAEAERLVRQGARLPSGKAWEAFRRQTNMPQYPRGLKAAVAALPADPDGTPADDE